MSDTPFIVSVRYREVTQPQPYCSQEAEVSAQYAIAEDADAEKAIAGGLAMVKRQTRIALNIEAGAVTAGATDPAKRGPGRPPKNKETTVAPPAPEPEPEAPKEDPKPEPAPTSGDDDFGSEPEAPAKEITDAEVQEACRKTVADGKGKVTAADVKEMAYRRYGTNKVVAIKQGERQKFLDDLKNLLAEKTAK